jgi:hypothetical protein
VPYRLRRHQNHVLHGVIGGGMLVGMGEHVSDPRVDPPAMLFDLDGTLIDSVLVRAWC